MTATSHYPTPRCRRGRGIFVKRGGGVRPSRETPIYRRPVYIAIPVRPPAPPAAKAGHRCGISDHASRPSPPPTSLLFPTSGSLLDRQCADPFLFLHPLSARFALLLELFSAAQVRFNFRVATKIRLSGPFSLFSLYARYLLRGERKQTVLRAWRCFGLAAYVVRCLKRSLLVLP